jgi:hypothetical protein
VSYHPLEPARLRKGEYFFYNGRLYVNRHNESYGWVFPGDPNDPDSVGEDDICTSHVHRTQIILARQKEDGTYAPAEG